MSDKQLDAADKVTTKVPGGAVIRRLEAAEETAQERLLKKHVPAWVVSGAMHVVIIALLILVLGTRTAETKPDEKPVNANAENKNDPVPPDLTNTDKGLESQLESSLPEIERIAEQTVKEKVTMDVIGQPDAKAIDFNALQPTGLPSSDFTTAGVDGTTGTLATGNGGGGGLIDASFAGRSGGTKDRLLREGGGNKDSELAVALGLAWLATQQKRDPRASGIGWWEFDAGSHAPKRDTKPERLLQLRALATGFALLPFLAAGQTHRPDPDGKPKKYQDVVARSLAFLKSACPIAGPNAGKMSDNMYEQAIAALPLVEAYGMTKDPSLRPYAQAVVNFIQRSQANDGSWGYTANSPGDTSIVGWEIQVLAAAKLTKDLIVDDRVIRRAMKFLDSVSMGSKKSFYGYRNPEKRRTLTPVGLLCRYYMDGWGPNNPGLTEGVEFLLQTPPPATAGMNKSQIRPVGDLYYFYYATQVVHFAEGESWRTWNEGPMRPDGTRGGGIRDWLVKTQVTGKDPSVNGSWDPESGGITFGGAGGRLATTAIVLLTLEVYYRHLPLYKRGADPNAVKVIEDK